MNSNGDMLLLQKERIVSFAYQSQRNSLHSTAFFLRNTNPSGARLDPNYRLLISRNALVNSEKKNFRTTRPILFTYDIQVVPRCAKSVTLTSKQRLQAASNVLRSTGRFVQGPLRGFASKTNQLSMRKT